MQMLIEYLSQILPLPLPVQRRLMESCSIIRFEKNDNIDTIGKTPEFLLMIKSGLVKSSRQTTASTLITGFKGPGDLLFNVKNLFRSEPTEEGSNAVQDTTCLAIPYSVIHDLYGQYPEFALNLLQLIDLKLVDLQQHVDLLARTTDQRILYFSKRFNNIYGNIPRREICRFLCISEATFYAYIKQRSTMKNATNMQSGLNSKISITPMS